MATSPKSGPRRPRRSDVNNSPPPNKSVRHDPIIRKDKGKQKATSQDVLVDDETEQEAATARVGERLPNPT